MTLSKGVSIEIVLKLLVHTKIGIIQIYTRALKRKLGEDIYNLKQKLNQTKNPNYTEVKLVKLNF